MGVIAELWLPILLSSVLVFIASMLAWMILPHHKPDWKKIPNEEGFLEGLRANSTPAGQYMFPFCDDPKALKDPENKKKFLAGPHGMLIVRPGAPNMGINMAWTMVFYLVVGLFVGYLGTLALGSNPPYMMVFRVTACAAIMAYCFGFIPQSIWFGKTLRSTVMDVADGIAYGLITAGTFAWLWPRAELPLPA